MENFTKLQTVLGTFCNFVPYQLIFLMRNTNEQSLKQVLKDMVETYRLKARLNQSKIQRIWERIMGQAIAKYTKEIKLRRDKLYLTIDSSALKQELTYGKDKIANMINTELGEDTVKEVIIQ